ncbi:MAG TPA: hypothetical protein VMY76_00465 [Gemmatimonadales bacterium]|nr:hypothetical protein [Gemmatimonadales bacterium]
MSRWLRLLIFGAVVDAGTIFGGWWTVPIIAAVWLRALPRWSSARSCMLGAALGWAGLLGWTAVRGPVDLVARRVGGVLELPVWGLPLLTLVFPALLAGLAARAVRSSPTR